MKTLDFHTDILPMKDRLFRLALSITLDRTEAEDITQETLVRVWERRKEWPQIENIQAWCMTIARRLALDAVEKAKIHAEREAEVADYQRSAISSPAPADEALDRRQRVEAVRRLISQLPEVQRTVYTLKYFDELKYSEISKILDTSEGALKASYHLAVKKITEYLHLGE